MSVELLFEMFEKLLASGCTIAVQSMTQLVGCAVELRSCSELREVCLESNRLAMPVMDLRSLSHLHSLQLWGNPLEFVPELSPCTALRSLSLVNVNPLALFFLPTPLHRALTFFLTPR